SVTERIAACWYGAKFNVDVNATDGQTHRLALYCLDWDPLNRAASFTAVDAVSGAVLDGPRPLSAFSGGAYMVWDVKGHVTFKIPSTGGGGNTVISGIFFGTAGNTAPVIASSPTATPNPATVGSSVTFSGAATDANGDTLAYT